LANVVLDTHAFVWYASDRDRLSVLARAAIDGADELGISAFTPWEVALLVARGKLQLGDVREWMRLALRLPRLVVLPFTPEIAIRAVELRGRIGKDPADCAIVATALSHGAPLVTRDGLIQGSAVLRCIW
jgi:PIN domain nuclease of toxin-antitoxin system